MQNWIMFSLFIKREHKREGKRECKRESITFKNLQSTNITESLQIFKTLYFKISVKSW